MIYDVIVIGGGPAGVAAVVYAARKRLNTLLITESFGGQSIVAADIQNWIGDIHISGYDLAKKLEAHARAFPDVVSIAEGDKAVSVKVIGCKVGGRVCDFEVKTVKGKTYTGESLIIASGARRRKLGVPGEAEFEGRGVSYCSTCDAPLFKDKDVAVVGGGNAGLETILDLVPYAKKMYLLERGNALTGDLVTQEKVKAQKNIKVIFNAEVLRVEGEKFIKALAYKDTVSGKEHALPVGGVFVAIGSVPNSETVKDVVECDKQGQVITEGKHAQTSHLGIFAAGDVTDDPYKQNNISAGDGARAALAAYAYLKNRKKQLLADG